MLSRRMRPSGVRTMDDMRLRSAVELERAEDLPRAADLLAALVLEHGHRVNVAGLEGEANVARGVHERRLVRARGRLVDEHAVLFDLRDDRVAHGEHIMRKSLRSLGLLGGVA